MAAHQYFYMQHSTLCSSKSCWDQQKVPYMLLVTLCHCPNTCQIKVTVPGALQHEGACVQSLLWTAFSMVASLHDMLLFGPL